MTAKVRGRRRPAKLPEASLSDVEREAVRQLAWMLSLREMPDQMRVRVIQTALRAARDAGAGDEEEAAFRAAQIRKLFEVVHDESG